ncbi:unnamed protein product [Peniophora sp. CBMAI 1063]|nr:unnamed protein product [Peniophora sp. CBMAI 1063]
MRVRLRSPTPDWMRAGEDVPGPVLGSGSEECEQVAVPNKSTERSRRHRALKGGGRKEGKQKFLRRKRDILGQCSDTRSSFALRSAKREASLTAVQTLREKAEVDGFLTYLGYFDPHPGRPPIANDTRHSFVRRYILEQLARVMAAEEGAVCGEKGTRASPAHFARRLVAGWGQILDLWEAGEEDALGRAHEEGALILRGAQFNTLATGLSKVGWPVARMSAVFVDNVTVLLGAAIFIPSRLSHAASFRLTEYQEPAGRTRSGRELLEYQPEAIEAPINYPRLFKFTVEVQLNEDEAVTEGADHCLSHRESPLSSGPLHSFPPPRRGAVFIVPLYDIIGEIAAAEVASDLDTGLKRRAGGSGNAGDVADGAPSLSR